MPKRTSERKLPWFIWRGDPSGKQLTEGAIGKILVRLRKGKDLRTISNELGIPQTMLREFFKKDGIIS